MSHKELYIGLLSGTSLDAIDAALVGLNTHIQLVATHSEPIPTALKQSLLDLYKPGQNAINRMGRADIELGRLFAQSCLTLLKKANVTASDVRAIGSHGQTIRHVPNTDIPFTLQIGDPNTIAALTHITTIADFRRRDMTLGGQGAPLTPAFHNFLLRDEKENRWVLNIGGIANVTFLSENSKQDVLGFDTGPGNTLLDNWCREHLKKPYDDKGEWAAGGTVNPELLSLLLIDPYFHSSPPKSTGPEYFNLKWLQESLDQLKKPALPQDVQATLLELTAKTIADAIQSMDAKPGSIWICGGGIHNQQLTNRLQSLCKDYSVKSTEVIGIHPDWIEAAAFAWLAQQTLHGKSGNLPSVTGASHSTILGGIFPS